MLLTFYRFLSLLAAPPLLFFLKRRQKNGKEHEERLAERWGVASIKRPPGKLVWLHAASVGETQSVLPLIRRLLDAYSDIHLLLTTGTVSSESFVAPKLPARTFHQFIPVDTWPAVARFLDHWQPDLAIWVESELWPNLLQLTHRSGCPLTLVNARMSEKSFRFWRRFPSSIKRLLACFSLITAQTSHDEARLKALGANSVLMPGNLKEDAEPLPADLAVLEKINGQIGARPVWLAASTHFGEETVLVQAHNLIAAKYPDLLTIIVPRHPPRGEKIAAECQEAGLKSALRSLSEPIQADTAVYIADTIGELGIFYRLSDIVFMGGSLIPHGGQNPLEAARLNAALLAGPHTHNFPDVYTRLEAQNGLIRASNAKEIANGILRLLDDKAYCAELIAISRQDVHSRQGALAVTLDLLAPYIRRENV